MKKAFSKFRFWLASYVLLLSILIMDKKTVESISFIVAIENWINWLEENKYNKEGKEEID